MFCPTVTDRIIFSSGGTYTIVDTSLAPELGLVRVFIWGEAEKPGNR